MFNVNFLGERNEEVCVKKFPAKAGKIKAYFKESWNYFQPSLTTFDERL